MSTSSPLRLSGLVFAAILMVGCGEPAGSAPVALTPEKQTKNLSVLTRELRAGISDGFACIYYPQDEGRLVVVVRPEAKERATAVVKDAGLAHAAAVRAQPGALLDRDRQSLIRKLRVTNPEPGVAFPGEEPATLDRCPKAVIKVGRTGTRSDDRAARWAAGAQARYGPSRLVVQDGSADAF